MEDSRPLSHAISRQHSTVVALVHGNDAAGVQTCAGRQPTLQDKKRDETLERALAGYSETLDEHQRAHAIWVKRCASRVLNASSLPTKMQKRPTIEAKETYYRGKRDLL